MQTQQSNKTGLAQRQAQFNAWTDEALNTIKPTGKWELSPVAGDASLRRYFRAKNPANDLASDTQHSLIVMDCPSDAGSLTAFIDIDQRLRTAGVHAPKIFAKNLSEGFLLLEDFGDELIKNEVSGDRGSALLTEDILPLLERFKQTSADELPVFGKEKIQQELDLFNDWHCKQHLNAPLTKDEREPWQRLCELLINTIAEIPQCFIHLDFHSCNLLRLKSKDEPDKSVGVIDFQDARQGPVTYDLASWLWDRYISWPRNLLEQWIEEARLKLAPEIDAKTWMRWVDLTGLQRNLKVVGIFARLHYRDNKTGYLELAPRFAQYILDISSNYPELDFCSSLLNRTLQGYCANNA